MYVASLTSYLKANSIQYADDNSLSPSSSIRNIQCTIKIMETDIKNLNQGVKQNFFLGVGSTKTCGHDCD